MFPCRLIIDPPSDGAWNMAVDEALLDAAADDGVATLRLYQWREPTMSLGYFQRYDERATHPASAAAPAVRRLTGGGALIHDRELTYSLALPGDHSRSGDWASLYCVVHRAVVGLLAEYGVAVRRYADSCGNPPGPPPPGLRNADEPFLCYARRTADDLVAPAPLRPSGDAKIMGSAQRRRRRAVLQHGALLGSASPLAPELPGLAEANGLELPVSELAEPLADRIAAAVDLAPLPTNHDQKTLETAEELAILRYRNESWTRRR